MTTYALVPVPPNITCDMLEAQFWLDRIERPARAFLSAEGIDRFNAHVRAVMGIPDVLDLPDTLNAADVRAQIAQYRPPSTCYDSAGQPLEAAYFETLLDQTLPALPDRIPVTFGLAVQRTTLRSFPTDEIITSQPFQFEFDRLQETTVDVGWPIAMLVTSRDGHWCFCLTPMYWGWIRIRDVAVGSREQIARFVTAEAVVVTTAPRGGIGLESGGSLTPQMGTTLPLVEETHEAYRVSVPERDENGELRISTGIAAIANGHFSVGHLPCTQATLITQAFKLLGEPYAWGGLRLGIFGRDCSRLIRDVFAVTGVLLPRNTGQQERVGMAVARFPAGLPDDERKTLIVEQVPPGAVLALPGHVMLYLGHTDGTPYAIHATNSNGFSHVIVSDLHFGAQSASGSLLQRLTSAVTLG
ncbi:SH3 domain-containing protein [Aggregatilinea lenta]|uniref:SH3 domain-containing protein n=1 Tax=Aggregatilinea lenta TaxID=913108 RepID=UPI000E5B0DCB|nr:SH3 domain-containing protein [Aggregatilinea lenta]